MTPAVLTIEDTATYLNTTVRHVRRLVFERRVPYYKVGSKLRFRQDDLDGWLEAHRIEVAS